MADFYRLIIMMILVSVAYKRYGSQMNNTINTIRLNKFLQILFRNHFALVKWVIIDFERSSIEKKSVTIKGNEVDGRLATNEIQFEISAL